MDNLVLCRPFRPLGRLICFLIGCHIWCPACREAAKFHCTRCGLIEQIYTDDGEPL